MTDRETRIINCDPQELRRGLLQSELQLEKEVEQNLAYFWTSKTDKKKCEGEKENESQSPQGIKHCKFLQSQKKNLHYIGNHEDPQLSFLLLSGKMNDFLEKCKLPRLTEKDKDRLNG